ncbi:MAG: hypothetical protein CL767_05995 [Chloroflexi bacterium]|nr:hypothetical protein [Chloroflexota bacterium]
MGDADFAFHLAAGRKSGDPAFDHPAVFEHGLAGLPHTRVQGQQHGHRDTAISVVGGAVNDWAVSTPAISRAEQSGWQDVPVRGAGGLSFM